MRSGQIVAMAKDILDFADALGLEQFCILGHDWGARIAYCLASLFPQRVMRIGVMSVAWAPGELATPPLRQARHIWYQWFMATDRGAEVVRTQGENFARFQWETWSPAGWFTDSQFETTATSFENPDWPEITLHSYRVRWGQAAPDPWYEEIERQAKAVRKIAVPALVIHGREDQCALPASFEGNEEHFTGPYQRHTLEGVGHFPTREAPRKVVDLVLDFLSS